MDGARPSRQLASWSSLPPSRRFVGRVIEDPQGQRACAPLFGGGDPSLLEGLPEPGSIVQVDVGSEVPSVRILARAGTARARLFGLLVDRGLDPSHPPHVLREVERWVADPGIDDPSLVDLTGLPFVTVDGPGTRDLDQALHVQDTGAHFVVRYAIADAAWYVRPGTALFDEALRRGASFYLPGFSVPMLPPELSEGLVSLGPGVDRRSTVFEMHVDRGGRCRHTRLIRARIHSRAQLTFDGVQAFFDAEPEHGIDDPTVVASLLALREVGERRLERAAVRGAVAHRPTNVSVTLGREGYDFVVLDQPRNDAERYSEQLSLLCNVEGAKLLRAGREDATQPIYRTHDPPDGQRLAELRTSIERLVARSGLPETWVWKEDRTLAAYVAGLPVVGPHGRLARALARQAIMVNVRSTYSSEPGPHFGIGAHVYARFSAPMREIVGVFVHKELWEGLSNGPGIPDRDEALRDRVIEQSNRAREIQCELTRAANLLVLDELFEADLRASPEDRPRRVGTVMGFQRGKVYVQLDDPPLEVKVYTAGLGQPATVDEAGLALVGSHGDIVCSLGDAVELRTERLDHDGRFMFEIRRVNG